MHEAPAHRGLIPHPGGQVAGGLGFLGLAPGAGAPRPLQ